MVFPFQNKNPPKRVGLGNKGCYYYLSFHFARTTFSASTRLRVGLGNQANLRLAPGRDFGMTRQIGVDMGVDDAVGIVLQYFKFMHAAIKTSGLHLVT